MADIWAARGYYTAILSQVVGPQGVVYSANPSSRPEFTDRWKQPIYANVRIVDGPFDKIALPQDGSLDFVIIHLNYHDLDPEVAYRDEQENSRRPKTWRRLCRGRSFGQGWHRQ